MCAGGGAGWTVSLWEGGRGGGVGGGETGLGVWNAGGTYRRRENKHTRKREWVFFGGKGEPPLSLLSSLFSLFARVCDDSTFFYLSRSPHPLSLSPSSPPPSPHTQLPLHTATFTSPSPPFILGQEYPLPPLSCKTSVFKPQQRNQKKNQKKAASALLTKKTQKKTDLFTSLKLLPPHHFPKGSLILPLYPQRQMNTKKWQKKTNLVCPLPTTPLIPPNLGLHCFTVSLRSPLSPLLPMPLLLLHSIFHTLFTVSLHRFFFTTRIYSHLNIPPSHTLLFDIRRALYVRYTHTRGASYVSGGNASHKHVFPTLVHGMSSKQAK